MNHWISVESSLPEEGKDVLVCIETGSGPFDWDLAVMRRYQHWRWDSPGRSIPDTGDEFGERVTHWRKLPKRP